VGSITINESARAHRVGARIRKIVMRMAHCAPKIIFQTKIGHPSVGKALSTEIPTPKIFSVTKIKSRPVRNVSLIATGNLINGP